jgi:hypothetical protein
MLKAADALADDGYDVVVVATSSTPWAEHADIDVLERRRGRFRVDTIDYSRAHGRLLHLKSGLRRRIARSLASRREAVSFRLATSAFARVHEELADAAVATSADFYYGGTTGGVAAAFEAATHTSTPYALDLEDFFSGEPPEGSLDALLAERIEREILPGARFLTAASGPIAEAYRFKYGLAVETLHNVFPLPAEAPELDSRGEGPLRMYWFSQTIGPGRGIEDAIEGAGRARIRSELHLRGAVADEYLETLRALGQAKAPNLALAIHSPGFPDEMTELAAPFDVGLSLEQPSSVNRRLCLTNKALIYPLAGLALAMTDTPGQRSFASELGDDILVVPPGDVEALAEGLGQLASDRSRLLECRKASWGAAIGRWHWEHKEERGKLLGLFEDATR